MIAGEIRVLTSPQLISEVLQVGQKGPITVSDVLEVLRLQISVVECDIFAYPSVESDLVLLIVPVTSSPTSLQVRSEEELVFLELLFFSNFHFIRK